MKKKIDTIKKILLIRTDRIGDVVLTLPAATVIKQKLPHSQIFFLTRSYTRSLPDNYEDLAQTLIYQPNTEHRGWSGIRKLAQEISRLNLDAAVLFYPTFPLALALYLARIPVRVGIGFRWYSFLFNRRHMEHRKYGRKHELEYNLALLEELFPDIPKTEIRFNFNLKEPVLKFLETELSRLSISEYIIIHPGSGGSAPNLTLRQYQEIIEFLLQNTPFQILLTGAEDEVDLHRSILSPFTSTRIISVAGRYNLEELMAIISAARLFISSSTGPLHIANAFRVPVLAFYCPARPCSPTRWGPYHQQKWVLTPQVTPCNSCNIARCPHGNCIEKIPTPYILIKLEERLKNIF